MMLELTHSGGRLSGISLLGVVAERARAQGET